ncbi:hypothetical protein V6Z11_A08G073000 [Gossypium hirsutum]
MVVWLKVAVIIEEGTLKLFLSDYECHVKDISINIDGGAFWLYQGIIDAFRGKIMSEVENAIIKKIKEGIIKLNSLLQSLPKQLFYLPLTVQICIDNRSSRHGYCSFTLVWLCERTYCEQMEVIFVHESTYG